MADGNLVDQILQLVSQLTPEESQALMQELAAMGGAEEEAPVPPGTVSPEGGVSGVPVK